MVVVLHVLRGDSLLSVQTNKIHLDTRWTAPTLYMNEYSVYTCDEDDISNRRALMLLRHGVMWLFVLSLCLFDFVSRIPHDRVNGRRLNIWEGLTLSRSAYKFGDDPGPLTLHRSSFIWYILTRQGAPCTALLFNYAAAVSARQCRSLGGVWTLWAHLAIVLIIHLNFSSNTVNITVNWPIHLHCCRSFD